jgi:hypothetical protein
MRPAGRSDLISTTKGFFTNSPAGARSSVPSITPRSLKIRKLPRFGHCSTGSTTTATRSTKAAKEYVDASGQRKIKGNMDIEIAVDALELAGHVDQMVLFSGDGDFRSLVEAVQRRGVHVTVVSSMSVKPPMVADELRRQADVFTDVIELRSKIGREPAEHSVSRERGRTSTRRSTAVAKPEA